MMVEKADSLVLTQQLFGGDGGGHCHKTSNGSFLVAWLQEYYSVSHSSIDTNFNYLCAHADYMLN